MNSFDPHGLITRNQVLKATRVFFEAKGLLEVIPPVLNHALPMEPNLYAFETTWNTSRGQLPLYLSLSPEAGLKKLMAEGIGDCFALGKSFRNLESHGSRHNPEFLMLEWYRAGATYQDIMDETQALLLSIKHNLDSYHQRETSSSLTYQHQVLDFQALWPRISLDALFVEHVGLSIQALDDELVLRDLARNLGYSIESTTWEQLFDQIFLNEIEPHLALTPFFLIDFPARLSPLCQPQASNPFLAERFELYIAGMELGNGNTENLHPGKIGEAFEAEAETRHQSQRPTHPIDTAFISAISALNRTAKSYAGIGLGMDRVAMIFADSSEISDVEYFSQKAGVPLN